MFLVIISSLILLSANLVVSHSTLENGLETVLSNQLSSQCYKAAFGILNEKNKNFKDLFAELINGDHNLEKLLNDRLSEDCRNEVGKILIKESDMFANLKQRYFRSKRSFDLFNQVPQSVIGNEWNQFEAIIADQLPKECLKNLEDIIQKNSKNFQNIFIDRKRSARSVEVKEIIDNLFGLPKQFCNLFSNGLYFIDLIF